MDVNTVRDRVDARWRAGTADLIERVGRLRIRSGRESVRKLRKAVRQLRFLLETWRPDLEREDRRALRRDLRELARALAPARDAAVHEACTRAAARSVSRERSELAPAARALVRRLRERRRAMTWPAVDVADALRHAELGPRLEACTWSARDELAQPATERGDHRFRVAVREALAAAEVLEAEDREPERHRLRKLARIPIALDAVLAADAPRPGIAALRALRLGLGDLHDLEDSRDRLLRLRGPELEVAGELEAYDGVPAETLTECLDRLLERFDRRHASLLEETRAGWPELRGRLQDAAVGG